MLRIVVAGALGLSVVRAVLAQGSGPPAYNGPIRPIDIGTYMLARDGGPPPCIATVTGGLKGAFPCRTRIERYEDGGALVLLEEDWRADLVPPGSPVLPEPHNVSLRGRILFHGDGVKDRTVIRLPAHGKAGSPLAGGHVDVDARTGERPAWAGDIGGWLDKFALFGPAPLTLKLTSVRETASDAAAPYEIHGVLDGVLKCTCPSPVGYGPPDVTLHLTF